MKNNTKIVKSIIVLVIFMTSQIGYSQMDKEISISFEKTTIKEALVKLENNYDLHLNYQENWFDDTKISIVFTQTVLHKILEDILQNTEVNFLFYDNKIILTKNSIIHKELPINYFSRKRKEEKSNLKSFPIFQKAYVSESKNGSDVILTVGKENRDSSKKTFIVNGYVINSVSDAPIQGVKIITNTKATTHTNKKGFFSISVPVGLNIFTTNVPGFDNLIRKVVVFGNGSFNLVISESVERLGEVVIVSNKDDNVRKAVVGITKIDIRGVKTIPLVLGEKDLLKIATTMPGVKTAGEGSLGYNVRGGKVDQNLILFDNAALYNPSHFFGVFSAINPYSTGNVEIYKGSIPAEFGGRLSSVIDISTKELNTTKFSGQGNIGPVTGNLTLETPIVKNKTAFLVGFRSTYSDWILKRIPKESIKNSKASFYDGILRFDSDINPNNELKATGYYSSDQFSISSDSIYKYNNRLASLEWNHRFNTTNKSSFQLNNSQYNFNITYEGQLNRNFDLNFVINETQFKYKLKNISFSKHKFDYGISSKLYNISPGEINPLGENSVIQPLTVSKEKALESAVYVSDLFEVSDKLLLNVGLRYSYYVSLGEGIQNVYDPNYPMEEETILETVHFNNNEVMQTYAAPEIRASARFSFTPNLSLKAGYNNTVQYLHMLSSNTTASPIDTWKLSNSNIKPQESNQYSLGLFRNSEDNNYEVSLEGYYKEMNEILDFKVGADLLLNENIETELLSGKGKAYGIEFLLKKKKGKLNGWLGYSYSKTFLKLNSDFLTNQVNNGEFFPANYDKPHDISLIANYKLTKRYSFSMNFAYQTGRPITYPIGKYNYGGIEHVLYSDRNQFRIPDYYRFDVGINIEGNHKIKKLAHSFWNISVYNVLGRNNPYSVFFVNENGHIQAYKTSIFAVPIPTITYNFQF